MCPRDPQKTASQQGGPKAAEGSARCPVGPLLPHLVQDAPATLTRAAPSRAREHMGTHTKNDLGGENALKLQQGVRLTAMHGDGIQKQCHDRK